MKHNWVMAEDTRTCERCGITQTLERLPVKENGIRLAQWPTARRCNPKRVKLTPAQKRMIEQLRKAEKIAKGVTWYVTYTDKQGRFRGHLIDSRVCNALERMGILQPTEDGKEYKLVTE